MCVFSNERNQELIDHYKILVQREHREVNCYELSDLWRIDEFIGISKVILPI